LHVCFFVVDGTIFVVFDVERVAGVLVFVEPFLDPKKLVVDLAGSFLDSVGVEIGVVGVGVDVVVGTGSLVFGLLLSYAS